jgi:hypothetical protein
MILAGFGITSSGVDALILRRERGGQFTLQEQQTFELQSGDRPAAYARLHQQICDFVEQRKVECACMKESVVSLGGTKKNHLLAAEIRGVVQGAAAAITEVRLVNKASASRNFGSKKVDDYLKDDQFWSDLGLENLPKGKREAAFSVLFHFKNI